MLRVKLKIRSSERTVQKQAAADSSLLRVLNDAGFSLPAYCGGTGTCGKCRVVIKGEVSPPTAAERFSLSEAAIKKGERLACQVLLRGDCDIALLAEMDAESAFILADTGAQRVHIDPMLRRITLELEPPRLEDNPSDLESILVPLKLEGRPPDVPLELLRRMPHMLREHEFKLDVIASDTAVYDIAASSSGGELYGIAFDIGTTTIVGKLYDLHRGRLCGTVSRLNEQSVHGADVISRIHFAQQKSGNLKELRKKVISTLNDIIDSLCEEAFIARETIYLAVCAGNTVMAHFSLGVSAEYLAQMPYVPVFTRPLEYRAEDLGINICPRGAVYFFPAIGRFVGGDTVAVILASGLERRDGTALALDIGTNGEIVLAHNRKLYACSTAAGPAFEGSQISEGMRASTGAIDFVGLADGEVTCNVIGGGSARGICGSGLIDAIAVLLSAGVIDITGRMLPANELGAEVPDALKTRIEESENGCRFILAKNRRAGIALTQKDVREVQLAKGAIAAGIRMLLDEVQVDAGALSELYLAGAFGNYLRRENAVRIGLLPQVPVDRIKFIGNAACAGAEMALLSKKAMADAERISSKVTYVEIASTAKFQSYFAEEMLFPESPI